MPLAAIGGKRPLEVAGDPSYRVRLMGALLLLELESDDHDNAEHFRTLRSELSLPPIEPLDPSGLDVSSLSLVKLMRLDVPRLSDEQLLVALQRSVLKDLRATRISPGGRSPIAKFAGAKDRPRCRLPGRGPHQPRFGHVSAMD